MAWPLLDAPGFDRDVRAASLRTSSAVTALVTAGGLSLSLLIAVVMLSFDLYRAAPSVLAL